MFIFNHSTGKCVERTIQRWKILNGRLSNWPPINEDVITVTWIIWPHGMNKLIEFLELLNGIHSNIDFMMEIEKDRHLPFLDIDVFRKLNGSLGHTVYRKPTHNNFYLNSTSDHHPSNKQAVLNTLVYRARSICDSTHEKLTFLTNIFKDNGYSHRQIQRALNPTYDELKGKEKQTSVALLPYIRITFNRVSRLLSR